MGVRGCLVLINSQSVLVMVSLEYAESWWNFTIVDFDIGLYHDLFLRILVHMVTYCFLFITTMLLPLSEGFIVIFEFLDRLDNAILSCLVKFPFVLVTSLIIFLHVSLRTSATFELILKKKLNRFPLLCMDDLSKVFLTGLLNLLQQLRERSR